MSTALYTICGDNLRRAGLPLAVLALALAPLAASAQSSPSQAEFAACMQELRQAARSAGVSAPVVAEALTLTEPAEHILALSRLQPEFRTAIWDYLAPLLDEERLSQGRALLAEHAELLTRIEQQYGVDRHVVVAVWGIESDYGNITGNHALPVSLSTLACASERRRPFWRGELIAALQLVSKGDLELDDLRGSWAGAFGQTQFIPTTYQRLAVDFDGDGRRDLIHSIPDALASTANYLARAKWQTGQPWLQEVRLPANYRGPSGRTERASTDTWRQRGLTQADGQPLRGNAQAGLLLPAGAQGPAFLVPRNFDAIFSYNRAESYALAISLLAQQLAGGPGVIGAWPTDDPGLSRQERRELQTLLLQRGHAIGEVDGRIGALSRAAIEAEEQAAGWTTSGRPGQRILTHLRSTAR